MTRHIIDHAKPEASGARVKHFLDLARKEGLHPAVKELNQRPADPLGPQGSGIPAHRAGGNVPGPDRAAAETKTARLGARRFGFGRRRSGAHEPLVAFRDIAGQRAPPRR